MQIKRQEIKILKPEFDPFEIVIKVETEEEAQALFAIFNYIPNIDLLKADISDRLKIAIGNTYHVGCQNDVIANGITYKQFYRPKVNS